MRLILVLVILAGAALWFCGNYTVLVYDGGVTLLKKDHYSLAEVYVNMKDWKTADYVGHADLVTRMAEQEKYKALPSGDKLDSLIKTGEQGAEKMRTFFKELDEKYDLQNKIKAAFETVKEKGTELIRDAKEGIQNLLEKK